MVRITMRYFAQCRGLAGCDDESFELPARTDVAAVWAAVAARHAALVGLLPHCRLAVREAFARGAVELAEGDELAVIPPVSGG